jgi:hypothetical protein
MQQIWIPKSVLLTLHRKQTRHMIEQRLMPI